MDALAAIVGLLRPQAIGAKFIQGGGRWGVRYPAFGQASFALVLKGDCWLTVDGAAPTLLETGEFILFSAMPGFTLASETDVVPISMKAVASDSSVSEIFHGDKTAEPLMSLLGGYFSFDPINSPMLQGLLPKMLRIRANEPAIDGIAPVIELIQREAREIRVGRSLVLSRLIEVMLIEALRSAPTGLTSIGLLAGLRDPQLAVALRGIHLKTSDPWTLSTLARQAGMSRSSFAERFARVIGSTPLNYLLQWRIAVAKNMLARQQMSVAETAIAVGYESASGFSTAFSRETGGSPKEFISNFGVLELQKK